MDLDLTLLLQLGLFLTLLVVLNGLLFKPFLRLLDQRDEKLNGQKRQVERLLSEAAKDLEVYQGRMREARDLAQKEREGLVLAGREEERRLLAEVRTEITRAMNEARAEVQQAERAAHKALSADTEVLARRLVERVLGREVKA